MSRIACAGFSVAFYFYKCVLPVGLMTIYPLWRIDPPSPLQFLPWLVLAGAVAFLWRKRATWGRHALLGLGFFVINLVPFIGLTAGSYMNYTWVMNHLVYFPILGLIGLALAALANAGAQLAPGARQFGAVLAGLVVAWMTWTSWNQAALYSSLEALWTSNVALNPAAALPHNDLGVTFARRGDNVTALAEFRLAAELDPRYTDAHHNLGITLLNRGSYAEALPEFEIVERLVPNDPQASFNLGLTLADLGRNDQAIVYYQRALALAPGYLDACNNLAILLVSLKRTEEAEAVLQAGLQALPGNAMLERDLAEVKQMENAPQPPPR